MIPATLILQNGQKATVDWIHELDRRSVRRYWGRVIGETGTPVPGLGIKLYEREWGGTLEYMIELSNRVNAMDNISFSDFCLNISEVYTCHMNPTCCLWAGSHSLKKHQSSIARFACFGTEDSRRETVVGLQPLMHDRRMRGMPLVDPKAMMDERRAFDIAVAKQSIVYAETTGYPLSSQSDPHTDTLAAVTKSVATNQQDPLAIEMDTFFDCYKTLGLEEPHDK